MIKIIQETINGNTRAKLIEGRTYQMGFAFAKKIENDVFQLVQPLSPCKDYLNDIVFSEHTGKKLNIYGCKSEKNDIFDDNAYLCFAIMPKKSKDQYNEKQMLLDIKRLSKVYPTIQKMINEIEDILKVASHTKITKVDDNLYLATVPLYWVQSTWAISLYSLLIRAFQYIGEYTDVLSCLKEYPYNIDQILVMQALPKLNFIIKNGFPKQDFKEIEKWPSSTIHNDGICAMNIS